MFQDVDQYTDFVVRTVGKVEGKLQGEALLGVVEWSAVSFGRYRAQVCGGVGVDVSGGCVVAGGGRWRTDSTSGESVGGVGVPVVSVGVVGGGAGGCRGVGMVVHERGENFERNNVNRNRRKAAKKASASLKAVVPNKLQESWIERKRQENHLVTVRMAKQLEKIVREGEDGTSEKKYRAEVAVLDGQLAGKYSLVAPERVVGFASSLASATSGLSSGAAGTIWSGTGASKVSRTSVSVGLLEKRNSELVLKLRESDRQLRKVSSDNFLLQKRVDEIEEEDSHGFNGHY